MSECTHNCSTCGENCASRDPKSFLAPLNKDSSVKKVVAVVSGKGGVGKSLVTGLMSVLMRRRGRSVAVLDADITGPSVPKMFGVRGLAESNGEAIFPKCSRTGIEMMSLNLLVDDERTPVIWRGPVIAGTVKQFWTDVLWQDVDVMFIDMPPGTGDVPLTVFQSIPMDGILVVTSPQELVSMIVEKALFMAEKMNVPVLGLVENYSYMECPDCGKRLAVFGESRIDEVAGEHQIPVLAKIPVNPALASACDHGEIEAFDGTWLDQAADAVDALLS